MKKWIVLFALLFSVAWSEADYKTAVPLKVGPVSVYGALGTSGNKVVSIATGEQVVLRGMSLFWSDAVGVAYYNNNAISWAADSLHIDVFRYAMAVQYYNSQGQASEPVNTSFAYMTAPDVVISRLDRMVAAAIENDIYIIIDWHSHRADSEQSSAVSFFTKMAERYKGIPNIIWEVYNEPVYTSMGSIASYANAVISGIRQNSPNLALVGTPNWSQMGECGGVNQQNVAYVFHFYAGSHSKGSYSGNVDRCMNSGNAVFISEWGTTSANGNGTANTNASREWTTYMDQKNISNCNWSLRHGTVSGETEASAMFSGSSTLGSYEDFNNATYSTSGNFVKNYLKGHARNWNDIYTSGARSGACAFDHQTISIVESSVSGKANGSCSYTSSNPDVATIESGTIKVKAPGIAVMTGNDGTKTIVRITPLPAQTVHLTDITCRLDNECTGGPMASLSGTAGAKEIKASPAKTDQGATITMQSDNPDVIDVKLATCSNLSLCYNDKNVKIWMGDFKSLGTANIHVTAPAVPGYAALDTTLVFEYRKMQQKMNTKMFFSRAVELGSTTEMLQEKAMGGAVVSYSLSDDELATIDGMNLIAGDKNGVLIIYAEVPEVAQYEALSTSISVTIGQVEAIRLKRVTLNTVKVSAHDNMLYLNVGKPGLVKVQVFDAKGKQVVRKIEANYTAGNYALDMSALANGLYLVKVEQNSQYNYTAWRKK